MHIGFVGAIIAPVVAVLGVFHEKVTPTMWAFGVLWCALFAVLNYDSAADRRRILRGVKRRDNAMLYTRLVDGLQSS